LAPQRKSSRYSDRSRAANDTMTPVTAPTDSPASPDVLRDDLAANLVPAVNNNLADLQAKVNAILAALWSAPDTTVNASCSHETHRLLLTPSETDGQCPRGAS
jgi:hypothetical protein